MPPKVKILRDRKYLDSFNGAACYACGTCDGTIVPAHIRHGFSGGMGLKPPDNLALPLCHACHALQHDIGELDFWRRAYPGTGAISQDMGALWAKKCAEWRYKGWKERQCQKQ